MVWRHPGRWPILFSLLILLPAFSNPAGSYRIRKVGKAPNFIALSPDGTKIYATSYDTNELLCIDLSKKMVTQSVEVGLKSG
jgi:YVTN family beta-propeller protein